MFLRYRYVLYAVLALIAAYLGWKWLRPSFTQPTATSTAQLVTSTVPGGPYLPDLTPTSTPETEADYRTQLKATLKNFQSVKSFRAKVTVGASDGEIGAVLEYAKPDRFRGTIQSASAGTAEIIAVADTLYMRVNNQQWVNLTKTPSAKTIGDTLKNALNGDSNLASVGLDSTLPVAKSRDEANACDKYATSVKTNTNTTNNVTLCVADGLPKYLDLQTTQGPIHLQYYDYNAVFIIEKPIS